MKRVVKAKNLIAFTIVLIVLISICATSYAVWNPFDYQRNRAFIAAALAALNIVVETNQMNTASIVEYVADPLNVNYTYVDMWNDRPQIQIWDDYVEIDGRQYTDIWISNEAAEKFRINANDFKTAFAITSNSNGTFASGNGTLGDMPLFNNGTTPYISQNYTCGFGYNECGGIVKANITNPSSTRMGYQLGWTDDAGYATGNEINLANHYPPYINVTYKPSNNEINAALHAPNGWIPTSGAFYKRNTFTFDDTDFDYDWVAQTIPADQPLPSDTGMMIRVPSDDGQGNRYFDTFLHDYPEFNQGEPVSIDVDIDPDIMNKLDDLIDLIIPIIPVINNNLGDVQFIENHEAPVPVPDTPIVDATVPQVINPIINEITNYGDQITQYGDQIVEQIPNIIESIPNITEICENIDTAPYHDLDTGLDHLPSFFLPFITDLRSALGIWHYVTEWLAQISTTFAFISGCLVGTSIMTPIYAAIAGFMCIKIYRRMTA